MWINPFSPLHRCSILLLLLSGSTTHSSSAAEKFSLRERVDGQRVVRSTCLMTADGLYFLDPPVESKTAKPDKAQPETLKVKATTKLVVLDRWKLSESADGPNAGVLTARRLIEFAQADVSGQVRPASNQIRKERRRFLTDIHDEMVRNGSLDGSITRQELEAITTPGDGITLWTLLPKQEVAVGETYKLDNLGAKSLTLFDTIAVNGLEGKIEKIGTDRVEIRIHGEVRGAVLGAEGKMVLEGTIGFNRIDGLVNSLVIDRDEIRRPGSVEAGLEIHSKLEVKREVVEKVVPELAAESDTSWPKFIENKHLSILWNEPSGLFSMEHDRDWHVTWTDIQESVIKRVDKGGTVIAQCNMKRGPTVAAGRHQDPAQFREDVRTALGTQYKRVFGEGVLDRLEGQGYGYKLAIEGLIQELPVVWYYYLMSSPAGDQYVSTITTTLAETRETSKTGLGLVESLKWSAQPKKQEESPK